MSVNLNSAVNNVNPGQFVQPEGVGENPVQVQMGGEVRELSHVEPDPALSGEIGGNPPFPEQPDPNALNVAQQNLSLPQEPPQPGRPIDERKVEPGDAPKAGVPVGEQVGGGGLEVKANKSGDQVLDTGVGEFELVEAHVVNNVEVGVVAKAPVKIADTDFKVVKALLASGKQGEGQFALDRQTQALTTVNDNIISFFNPKSNTMLSGLLSTAAENKSIRKAVYRALEGEVKALKLEIEVQKAAFSGDSVAAQRGRAALDTMALLLDGKVAEIKRTICPEKATNMEAALQKCTVATFANELSEIGQVLRTPPELNEVADYRQALDEYKSALTAYGAALDENVQALNKYEDDCKSVKAQNEASDKKFDEAFETWKSANEEVYKLHEESRKAVKSRNEQTKTDYRKICEETVAKAKADYDRKCDDELAKLQTKAQNGHRAAYDAKVAKYKTHVANCQNGMAAHLSELKERFGTNTFEDLDRLMNEVFTKESSGYYVQLDGSTKGKLNWYGYKGYYFDSSGNADNNRAAWGQLKASLAHALWSAGLADDEEGKALIAKLDEKPSEKALDYAENYGTVKAVSDLIAAKGMKAPEAYKPLTESELKELVKYEPTQFDESSVALPPKPQLEEMPSEPKWAEFPAREEPAKMPERPKAAAQPRLGMLPSAPGLEQPPVGDDVASLVNVLTLSRKELEIEKLKNEAAELQNTRSQLMSRSREELGALFCRKYNVSSLHPVYALTNGAFASHGAAGVSSVVLLPDGQLSYQSESRLNLRVFGQYTKMTSEQNQTIRRGLMASFECAAWCAGIVDAPAIKDFLARAKAKLALGDSVAVGEKLDYSVAYNLLHEFRVLAAANAPEFVQAETDPEFDAPKVDRQDMEKYEADLAALENQLREKYGVRTFQPVHALANGTFASAATLKEYTVVFDWHQQLSYESGITFNMTPDQNLDMRNQLLASFERAAWCAGIADSLDFADFLKSATTSLMGAEGEEKTMRLSYDTVYSVLNKFKNLMAAAKKGEALIDEPIRTFPPINGGKTGAVGSMGSLGLSYAQFGSQLLNPLVEYLFSGLGVSVEGQKLSGDEEGLKLHIDSFDATAMAAEVKDGEQANNGLFSKYENVDIPITAVWYKGQLTFELGKLTSSDGSAAKLNRILDVVRTSGVLAGAEMPKGMSVTSDKALGVVCDLGKMDMAMLADMGFGANLAETIGGVRFSEKGVMIDFGKVDEEQKLPEPTVGGGAVNAHLNLGGILDRCGNVISRLLRDAMGVNVGSMKATTNPDNGTIKLSLGELSYFAVSSSWALSFAQNLGLTSFSGLEVTVRPTLNAKTGLLEVAVTGFNLEGGAGGLITKGVNSFMQKLLGVAASYLPDMMYVKEPEKEDELGVVAIAVPNLMPEQLAFLGAQKLETLAVTEQGLSVGIGMEAKPISLKKAVPPEPPVAPEPPVERRPMNPPHAPATKRLGHLGTIGVSYQAFSDEILRPLVNQVAMDLGIDLRGLKMTGGANGQVKIALSRLDLRGMIAKLKGSVSPTVQGMLDSFRWQNFTDVSISAKARWNADAGKLELELDGVMGVSDDGTTLNDLLQGVRDTGLLQSFPMGGGVTIEDRPAQPLKFSFDLSSVSVKELGAMGFNERLVDNVGAMRFNEGGVSMDIGAARPDGAEADVRETGAAALNAELDVGSIVRSSQTQILQILKDSGVKTNAVNVTANAQDGTLTVDLDGLNCDDLFDAWIKDSGFLMRQVYKAAKFFTRTPGASFKLRPAFDPVTGKTTVAITDISVRGIMGKFSGFVAKKLFGSYPNWLSAIAPDMLMPETAGKGEVARLAVTPSNLLPLTLSGFGRQKILGLRVTSRGLAVGIGTDWKANLQKGNQGTISGLRLNYVNVRQLTQTLLNNQDFLIRNAQIHVYLASLHALLDNLMDERLSTDELRERCDELREQARQHREDMEKGRQRMRELVMQEDFRSEYPTDGVMANTLPVVEDLADVLYNTLREV